MTSAAPDIAAAAPDTTTDARERLHTCEVPPDSQIGPNSEEAAPDPVAWPRPPLDFIGRPINPDTPRLFSVVSTFAGCGGSSLGYKWAGGEVLASVEWDRDAAETYRRNHDGTPVLQRDITGVSGAELLQLTGLAEGGLDVFDGSPPCQGFSTAGRRNFADPRNDLFRQYVRLLREIRPKTFVMENVSGMVKGGMKHIFAEALRELKASGYVVRAWLLNAMYFGVPQSRERMIFVGVRRDLADAHGLTPTCPKPYTLPITFAEACADLRGNGDDDRMLGEFLMRFRHAQPQQWSTDSGKYLEMRGKLSSSLSLQWALWERVCGTILKSEFSLAGIVHPERERYISLAEARRCASFPDAFGFTNRTKGIARIGNSVPPKFMEAIASHVYETLLLPIRQVIQQQALQESG